MAKKSVDPAAAAEKLAKFKATALDKLDRVGGPLLRELFAAMPDDTWAVLAKKCRGRSRAIVLSLLADAGKSLREGIKGDKK